MSWDAIRSGFDRARQTVGDAASTATNAAANAANKIAREASLVALPDKLDLKQSKVMTQLVEKGLDALGYKIKMDGNPAKDVLDAVNDMRKKSGFDKLKDISEFGKDDLKAILTQLDGKGEGMARNVLNSIGDSLKATVTDFAASLPKAEVGGGATRRAPATAADQVAP